MTMVLTLLLVVLGNCLHTVLANSTSKNRSGTRICTLSCVSIFIWPRSLVTAADLSEGKYLCRLRSLTLDKMVPSYEEEARKQTQQGTNEFPKNIPQKGQQNSI